MTSKSVTKNTTYLTLAYIGQKVLSFFYFILVARFLEVDNLGKYTFALGFATMFSVFVDLGLTQALIRESAKYKEKVQSYLSSVLTVKLGVSFLVYFLIILVVNLLNYPLITKQLVYLAGLIMLLDQFSLTFWGVFRGDRNLKYESISVVINQVVILLVGLIILYLKLSLIWFMLPFILGSIFSFAFSISCILKKQKLNLILNFDKKILKSLFIISLPFALIAIFSKIYGYIDTVLLSKLIGDKAVGWYNVAMKIPFALQFIPAALGAAIYPAFSYEYHHDKNQLKQTFDKAMLFLTIVSLPISVGIAILAKPIILFFYADKYLPSVEPLMVLMAGLFFVFLNFPLGALLNSCDRQNKNAFLVGLTMVLNIILNIFLIPRYSFVGASLAFLISHSCLFIMSMVVAKSIIPYQKKYLLKIFTKAFVSATLMGLFLFMLRDNLNFIILIVMGAVVYLISLYILKGYTREDILYFANLFKKKKA